MSRAVPQFASAVVFYGLLLLLVLSPLPLGSNREWSWTLCTVLVAALAVAWSAPSTWRPAQVSRSLPLGLPVLFLAVCAWAWLQTLTTSPAGWHHPLWSLTATALDRPVAPSISLAVDDSQMALLRYVAYALLFFLAFQLCRDVRRADILFRWMALAGLAYAIYGLAMFWSGSERFLWFWEWERISAVRGTFVNRNTFATWLGLSLYCAVAVFYRRVTTRRNPMYQLPDRSSGPLVQQVERFVVKTWKPLALFILVVAALILTHSRGGFLGTLAGGVVLLVALDRRQRTGAGKDPRPVTRWAVAALLAVSLASFWLTSEVLLQRFDRSTADMDSRLGAYALAADGIEDNPILGFGYGTFADSFRLYRDERLNAHFRRTHNTYLENTFELGWPAALAQFALIGWLALICWRGVRHRHRDWVFPATGLAATTLVATHSLVDFSIQIPATALAYAGIMGAAVAQSYPVRRQ